MKTNWMCPKCNEQITTHIKTWPPVCHNQKVHSTQSITMEEANASSRKPIQRIADPGADE
jgi:hypothetical protein